ncbi:MAG: DNA-directed DNA polymerase [Edwardsiella phage MSW-3]|uniref:Putative DNA polymerase n=1 Tax=Edwardsiella phage MSW-3 TaxID=1264700 RepID=L0MX86_9CAUD|nr:DNA polymerase [Edwardsiella phage MSW-3]BAM68869.1 putative DNA polymerase [Edwardsiella phage MSW-3]BEU28776.1 MAG: DNA-directed DNA polymerase [Edwardsiella phage MSW-3]
MHFLSRCDELAGCGKTFPADLSNCPHCGADAAFSAPSNDVDVRDWGYDLESYPNIFTCTWVHAATGLEVVHEISEWKNDREALVTFMYGLRQAKARGIGFNNVGFDYPVLHWIAQNQMCDAAAIYDHMSGIIRREDKFGAVVWDNDRIFEQIDLYKICHFDNQARSTSLKAIEIRRRSRTVEDLPFPVGTMLTAEQRVTLLKYNRKDVLETLFFYMEIRDNVHFREELTERYSRNFMNHNDTKIGKDYFVMELEKAGVECFVSGTGGKSPRQTVRPSIRLGDVIFPYVRFERSEFQRVLDFFRNTTITQTKGVFSDVSAVIDGFEFVFGTGGIHGSVESQIVHSDETHQIVDIDVASFYPNLAISNRLYPEHLSEKFCDIYKSVYDQRKSYAKGTAENAMLKLALNGVYGDSNNVYSPFYDPAYTMGITINGQLLLCMLSEQLMKTPGLSMVQVNTDGVTVKCPRVYLDHMRSVCKWWESLTGLQLEEALYSRMIIRDVNNYIAEYDSGKLKRKGAYEYKVQWHQDPSALVVPKAAEAALVRGESIRDFITQHKDPYDFMCRAKVPRSCQLLMRWSEWSVEQQLQHITRYFVSRNGGSLVKILPPTGEPGTWKRKPKVPDAAYDAVMREITGQPGDLDSIGTPWDERIHTKSRSKHTDRESSMCAGWRVTECADAADFNWSDLNYDWYIQEAEKLVNPLLTSSSK